jgi:hypothetical protein
VFYSSEETRLQVRLAILVELEQMKMTRRDEWVVRLFQAGGLVIFLSGFVFFRWALLIWFMFSLYMTVGWMTIDNWTRHKNDIQSQKRKASAESVTVQMSK